MSATSELVEMANDPSPAPVSEQLPASPKTASEPGTTEQPDVVIGIDNDAANVPQSADQESAQVAATNNTNQIALDQDSHMSEEDTVTPQAQGSELEHPEQIQQEVEAQVEAMEESAQENNEEEVVSADVPIDIVDSVGNSMEEESTDPYTEKDDAYKDTHLVSTTPVPTTETLPAEKKPDGVSGSKPGASNNQKGSKQNKQQHPKNRPGHHNNNRSGPYNQRQFNNNNNNNNNQHPNQGVNQSFNNRRGGHGGGPGPLRREGFRGKSGYPGLYCNGYEQDVNSGPWFYLKYRLTRPAPLPER